MNPGDPLTGQRQALTAAVRGAVVFPGDAGYDQARASWNLATDQRPAAVVRAADADDVAAAVRFAAGRGLGVAIQCTGHGVARPADGGLLVLTEALDAVQIDPQARTARIEAGVQWGTVLEKAAPFGLAPLLGSSPGVGAVGFTLGGGLGWLARRHGLAADHVRWFEVVTADGVLRRTSAVESPGLFWALRGGGAGSLGAVTAMKIELMPVDVVYGGSLFYDESQAQEVAARYVEWIANAPDELTSSLVFMNFPPLDMVPEPMRGRSFVVVRGCHCGPVEDGEASLRFWRDWRTPDLDFFGPMPFAQAAAISNDPVDPMPAGTTSEWLRDLDKGTVDILLEHAFPAGPRPILFLEVRHVAGAMNRIPPDEAAYGSRHGSLLMEAIGPVPTPETAAALTEQLARLRERVRPSTAGGVYLNFLEGSERFARSAEAFTPAGYQRLQQLKRELDPQNVFRYGIDLIGR